MSTTALTARDTSQVDVTVQRSQVGRYEQEEKRRTVGGDALNVGTYQKSVDAMPEKIIRIGQGDVYQNVALAGASHERHARTVGIASRVGPASAYAGLGGELKGGFPLVGATVAGGLTVQAGGFFGAMASAEAGANLGDVIRADVAARVGPGFGAQGGFEVSVHDWALDIGLELDVGAGPAGGISFHFGLDLGELYRDAADMFDSISGE